MKLVLAFLAYWVYHEPMFSEVQIWTQVCTISIGIYICIITITDLSGYLRFWQNVNHSVIHVYWLQCSPRGVRRKSEWKQGVIIVFYMYSWSSQSMCSAHRLRQKTYAFYMSRVPIQVRPWWIRWWVCFIFSCI